MSDGDRSETNAWGYWVDASGVQHPLAPPTFSTAEEDREYIGTHTPGLTLWKRKDNA
jgi:hypothetical protein